MSRELPGGVRIGAYALALAVAFASAYAVGSAVGPLDIGDTTTHTTHDEPTPEAPEAPEAPRDTPSEEGGHEH